MSTSFERSPSSRPSLRRWLAVFAVTAIFFSGCVVYERSADVIAHWTFAGYDCREADVDLVEVVLESRHGSHVIESGLIPCEEGSVEFLDVEPGDYWILAYGFHRSGGYARWDLERRIELRGGSNEFTLDLVPVGSR